MSIDGPVTSERFWAAEVAALTARAEAAERERDELKGASLHVPGCSRNACELHGRCSFAEARALHAERFKAMDTVEAERDTLRLEVARLKGLLDRDRTGLARALSQIDREVGGRMWVADSRGCYEWDDDAYKAEAGDALRKVQTLATDALRESGTVANEAFYPRLTVERDAAIRERDTLRAKLEATLKTAEARSAAYEIAEAAHARAMGGLLQANKGVGEERDHLRRRVAELERVVTVAKGDMRWLIDAVDPDSIDDEEDFAEVDEIRRRWTEPVEPAAPPPTKGTP